MLSYASLTIETNDTNPPFHPVSLSAQWVSFCGLVLMKYTRAFRLRERPNAGKAYTRELDALSGLRVYESVVAAYLDSHKSVITIVGASPSCMYKQFLEHANHRYHAPRRKSQSCRSYGVKVLPKLRLVEHVALTSSCRLLENNRTIIYMKCNQRPEREKGNGQTFIATLVVKMSVLRCFETQSCTQLD